MGDDSYTQDSRYIEVLSDPRFRRLPKDKRKIKIDGRFKSMLHDDEFRIARKYDPRGAVIQDVTEDHKKFFDIVTDSDESSRDSITKNVSLQSSSTCSSDVDDDETLDINPNWDDWVNLDRDADRSEYVSSRLAVCNMDWDRISANDLFMSISSILPEQGRVVSVKTREYIEHKNGPQFDNSAKCDTRMDDEEQLRRYELDRLRYYYAIVSFDSVDSARHVYDQAESLEFESSSNRMDLRFVPDETEFDESDVRDSTHKLLDIVEYEPKFFRTDAVGQSKVACTWDDTSIYRADIVSSLHRRNRRGRKTDIVDHIDLCSSLVVNDEDAVMTEELVDQSKSDTDSKQNTVCDDDQLMKGFQTKIGALTTNNVFGSKRGRRNEESNETSDDSVIVDVSWEDSEDGDPTLSKLYSAPEPDVSTCKVQSKQSETSKRKKLRKKQRKETKEFEVDFNDPRFEAVFSENVLYNVDPNDPKFKHTPGMQKLVSTVIKRRAKNFE